MKITNLKMNRAAVTAALPFDPDDAVSGTACAIDPGIVKWIKKTETGN